ncbi:Tic20 family protein [Prochlorococcus marinus]|nr:Tic20 family protein [Prochlorococcus marinus]
MNQIFQRLTSAFMYTLPLKASIPFGYYLFYKYSFLKILLFLTFPVAIIEKSLPFGGFLLFIILFAGLARNPKVPYFVRYNVCQALLIDIALIIISYLLRIFPIVELGSIIFILIFCIFIYSISQCIFGVEPEIPLISKSVRMQI